MYSVCTVHVNYYSRVELGGQVMVGVGPAGITHNLGLYLQNIIQF